MSELYLIGAGITAGILFTGKVVHDTWGDALVCVLLVIFWPFAIGAFISKTYGGSNDQ